MENSLQRTKTPVLTFRGSWELKTALERFAAEKGVSVSEIIRRLADEAVGAGPSLFPDEVTAMKHLRGELKAIGRNLNQVARKVNSGEVLADPLDAEALRTVMARVEEVAQHLQAMSTSRRGRRNILRRRLRAAE